MNIDSFIILIINALAYTVLFLKYEFKKKSIDIGSIILLTWIIGSWGSVYYYTFESAYLSYDKITILPLVYLFCMNLLLFIPFLKIDFIQLKSIELYNLRKVFNVLSCFFAVISIAPLIDCCSKLASFSFIGAALADMYESDEDKSKLIFSPMIKPLFSIMRHFTVFIYFLFFYQLTRKKYNILIIIGLGSGILTFLLFSLLCGSRGGIVSTLLACAYFFLFMKNMMRPKLIKCMTYFAYLIVGCLILGISAISFSRLSNMNDQSGRELLMDHWISQYAGEGIIRFDTTIWNLDAHLNGTQTLPYLYSYVNPDVKDVETYAPKAEYTIKTPVTVFYTYIGDIMIDFGIIGTIIVVLIMHLVIRFLSEVKKGKISFYHVILLSFFYQCLTIGFTANLYRGYFNQKTIVENLSLLLILFIFQNLYKKYYAPSVGYRNTSL